MKKILHSSYLLYIPLFLIMIISLFNMQNAKLLSSLYQNSLYKQIIWYLIGLSIIIIMKKINIKAMLKYSKLFYYASVFLLLLVLIIGDETKGAKAWFNLGFFAFQPSELVKLSLTLYLSGIAADYKYKNKLNELKFILKVLVVTLIPSILVFLEPDTGAIIFYLIIAFSIIAFTIHHKFWLIILSSFIILFLVIFFLLYIFNQDLLINLFGTSFFYRVERLISFKEASNYQLENALIAIGSSSFLGSGLNNVSIYIPEAPTDFIFAFNISNFGLLSGFIILISYLLIDIFLIYCGIEAKNKQIRLITLCFIAMLFFGEVINISMNLGLCPIIGIPLPFLSYGGSTIIIYFIFLAIILNNFNKQNHFKKT